jgi:tripartite ATP-independent transporter DctP family solute receptor
MIADEISEKTGGNFTMEIHENGSLMTQEGEVDAVARGTLDMMFSSPFLISDQLPYLTMFTAAYIFKDEAHLRAVMDGEIGQQVADDVADKLGVRWLSALYCGARNLDLVDIGKEVKTPEDLNGVNLRMPNSSAWLFMGKALGANPTPMAFAEIYQGLQTGAIDGQENPLPTTIAQKWYEVTDQIVLTGHVIEPMCIAINEEKWQSLPKEYQDIMIEAIRTATLWCDEANIQEEQEAIDFLKEQGLTITEPDVDAFMEYSENYYLSDEEMTKDWDMDLYQQIKNLEY